MPSLLALVGGVCCTAPLLVAAPRPQLSPPPSTITREYGEVMKESRTVARKINKISLAQVGRDGG